MLGRIPPVASGHNQVVKNAPAGSIFLNFENTARRTSQIIPVYTGDENKEYYWEGFRSSGDILGIVNGWPAKIVIQSNLSQHVTTIDTSYYDVADSGDMGQIASGGEFTIRSTESNFLAVNSQEFTQDQIKNNLLPKYHRYVDANTHSTYIYCG